MIPMFAGFRRDPFDLPDEAEVKRVIVTYITDLKSGERFLFHVPSSLHDSMRRFLLSGECGREIGEVHVDIGGDRFKVFEVKGDSDEDHE